MGGGGSAPPQVCEGGGDCKSAVIYACVRMIGPGINKQVCGGRLGQGGESAPPKVCEWGGNCTSAEPTYCTSAVIRACVQR